MCILPWESGVPAQCRCPGLLSASPLLLHTISWINALLRNTAILSIVPYRLNTKIQCSQSCHCVILSSPCPASLETWMSIVRLFFGSCLFPSVHHHTKLRFLSPTCLPDTPWVSSQNIGGENGEKKPTGTWVHGSWYNDMLYPWSLTCPFTHISMSVCLQRNWSQKADLIYQTSKAGMEIGAILQIPCPVHIHAIWELATLINGCADLQPLMTTIFSRYFCHKRSRHQSWMVNTIVSQAPSPQPAEDVLNLPQGSGCEPEQHWAEEEPSLPSPALPSAAAVWCCGKDTRRDGLKLEAFTTNSVSHILPQLCDHGRYIDLADRLRSYSSVLYRWSVILVTGCLNNIVSLLPHLPFLWVKVPVSFRQVRILSFFFFFPQRLCLKDIRSHNNGGCFHEIRTD